METGTQRAPGGNVPEDTVMSSAGTAGQLAEYMGRGG